PIRRRPGKGALKQPIHRRRVKERPQRPVARRPGKGQRHGLLPRSRGRKSARSARRWGPVSIRTDQYLRLGSSASAWSCVNTPSSTTTRRGTSRPACTSRISCANCSPSSGLHSTVALSLPARIASNAPRTPSIDTMRMSVPGLRPASSIAWIAPIAMSSLCANSTSMLRPSALRKASITSLPRARVKSPLCERTIWKRASVSITSLKPFMRSLAGAEPTVPCSSTIRTGPAWPSLSSTSQRAARRPSSTKSEPIRVAYSDSSATLTARSVSTTGMPAALASRSTVSQPVSTTGEKAITSTPWAMNERNALIWFSCFCCASENLRLNSGATSASFTERVLAVRHSLSAPTWLKPTVIAPSPAVPPAPSPPPEHPASTAAHSIAVTPRNLRIAPLPIRSNCLRYHHARRRAPRRTGALRPSGRRISRLDRGVELHRVAALLARAVAGGLASTEGHVRIHARGRQVDHHHARLRMTLEVRGVLERGGADARAQPELGVVGHRQRLFVIVRAQHGCDRPEDFLAHDAVVRLGREQRGRQEVALGLALHHPATGQQFAAVVVAGLDVGQVGLELGAAGDRANVGARFQRIADADLRQPRLHARDELVVDRVLHDQAAGRGAALAGGEERTVDRALHRLVQVGIGQDHQRVLAAHLQLHLERALGRLLEQGMAGRHRSGEGQRVERLVRDQRLANRAATAQHHVEHALGQACA